MEQSTNSQFSMQHEPETNESTHSHPGLPKEVAYRPTSELKPHPLSLAVYGDDPIQDIKDSIATEGILTPLLVKPDGTIISGHRRYRAAVELARETVPIIEVTYQDQVSEEMAVIEANRQRVKTFSQKMREVGELKCLEAQRAKQRMVDAHAAKQTFAQQAKGQTNEIVGQMVGIGSREQVRKAERIWGAMEAGEPAAIRAVEGLDKGTETINSAYRQVQRAEAEKEPERERRAENELLTARVIKVEPGDILYFGGLFDRLVCGCSTREEDFERLMAGDQADLVVTDPPYGVDYHTEQLAAMANDSLKPEEFESFLEKAFRNIAGVMRPGANFYIFAPGGSNLSIFFSVLGRVQLAFRQMLTWRKPRATMGRQDYHYQTEQVMYGSKPGAAHHKVEDRTRTTLLDYPSPDERFGHLSPKPVAMVEQLIEDGSSPDERVLDAFGGTGTTLIAARRANRHCLMMEISPEHCQTIVWRYMTEFPGRLVFNQRSLSQMWSLAAFYSEAMGEHLSALGFIVDDDEMRAFRLLRWWFEEPQALVVAAQAFIESLEEEEPV